MNRDILIPRRNPRFLSKSARFIGKYRYYRFIGMSVIESIMSAWRAVK